jgi:hypothetical protein
MQGTIPLSERSEETTMRNLAVTALVLGVFLLAALSARTQSHSASPKEGNSAVIVFKDGREQSIPVGEITRIEFKASAMIISRAGSEQRIPVADISHIEFSTLAAGTSASGRGRFLGKWRVGQGAGTGAHFYITLERDGEATKSIGAAHGTWTLVDGEARINWDDGWHDVIRKAGNKYEKVAIAPGKTFGDEPENVTDAENTSPEPI